MTDPTRFSAYGLVFEGDVPMPWADPAPAGRQADVEIRFGRVPAAPGPVDEGAWRVENPCRAVLDWEGVRLLAEDGRRLVVDAAPGVDPDILPMLAAFAGPMMLLHQRAALPLHAGAAAGPCGGALFIGDAGAGKSTFAALMAKDGWALAGDDLVALDLSGPAPALHRGVPTARLFADASGLLKDAERVRRPGAGFGKELRRLDGPAAVIWPAPLRAVFALEWLHPADAEPEVERLGRLQALPRLRAAVARPEHVGPMGLEGRYFMQLARLAAETPVFALRRPRRFEAAPAALRLARETVAALAPQPAAEESASR